MTDLEALLEAAIAAPDDYAPRGVLADYLEERGDERHVVMRKAKTAAEALGDFPDHFRRAYPINVAWYAQMAFNVDGIGPRVISFDNLPVPDTQRVVLSIPSTGRPLGCHDFSMGIDKGHAEVWIRPLGDMYAFADFAVGNHSFGRWCPAPTETPWSKSGIEVVIRGSLGARVRLWMVVQELGPVMPQPYRQPRRDRGLVRRMLRTLGLSS